MTHKKDSTSLPGTNMFYRYPALVNKVFNGFFDDDYKRMLIHFNSPDIYQILNLEIKALLLGFGDIIKALLYKLLVGEKNNFKCFIFQKF